jgi:hypothetical protein
MSKHFLYEINRYPTIDSLAAETMPCPVNTLNVYPRLFASIFPYALIAALAVWFILVYFQLFSIPPSWGGENEIIKRFFLAAPLKYRYHMFCKRQYPSSSCLCPVLKDIAGFAGKRPPYYYFTSVPVYISNF